MGKKKATPKHEEYSKMQDTPWITQAREVADIGGKGVLDNYNKVNVFDEGTRQSLEARNNAIYKRAFDNMNRQYTDSMNRYNAKNYNQFGTLNATAPYYIKDNYQRDFQRQMNDLAYNQATNYDKLMDEELQRRYNTLDMFNSLYQYGNTPYQLDVSNYNVENTNKDLRYQNAMAAAQNGGGLGGILKGGINGAISGGMAGGGYGALAGAGLGMIGGAMQ